MAASAPALLVAAPTCSAGRAETLSDASIVASYNLLAAVGRLDHRHLALKTPDGRRFGSSTPRST